MVNQMVISTEIEWIGYDHKKSMLQVEFIEGKIYQYDQVEESVYHDFLNADSHCQFLDQSIKGKYPFRRVR